MEGQSRGLWFSNLYLCWNHLSSLNKILMLGPTYRELDLIGLKCGLGINIYCSPGTSNML